MKTLFVSILLLTNCFFSNSQGHIGLGLKLNTSKYSRFQLETIYQINEDFLILGTFGFNGHTDSINTVYEGFPISSVVNESESYRQFKLGLQYNILSNLDYTFFGGVNFGYSFSTLRIYEAPVILTYEYNSTTEEYYLIYKRASKRKDMILLSEQSNNFILADLYAGIQYSIDGNWFLLGSVQGMCRYHHDFHYSKIGVELSAGVRYIL